MTIPHLKQQEFIDFLKENGCEVVSDENWNDYDRIIMEKDGVSFPLQMCSVYYYYTVNKICEDLGIKPPDNCARIAMQIRERRRGR
jgi:hypothetical protein